jgi:hypothetical protein
VYGREQKVSTTVDTPAVTLVDTSEGAWTGFLRRRHRQLNSHYFGGRLSEPEIEFADLDEATTGTYGHRKGEPVIKLGPGPDRGPPVLCDSYATTAATARLAETLQHELCHQAATELYGYSPTGDDVADHRTFGFRAACDAFHSTEDS